MNRIIHNQTVTFVCNEGFPTAVWTGEVRSHKSGRFPGVGITRNQYQSIQSPPYSGTLFAVSKTDHDAWAAAFNKACTVLIVVDKRVADLETKLRKEYFDRIEAEMKQLVLSVVQSEDMRKKIEEIVHESVQKEILKVENADE